MTHLTLAAVSFYVLGSHLETQKRTVASDAERKAEANSRDPSFSTE